MSLDEVHQQPEHPRRVRAGSRFREQLTLHLEQRQRPLGHFCRRGAGEHRAAYCLVWQHE